MIGTMFARRGVFTKTDLILSTKVASTCDECLGQGYMEGQYAFTPFTGMVPVPCKYCLGTGTIYTDYAEWVEKMNKRAAQNYLTYPNGIYTMGGSMTSGSLTGFTALGPLVGTTIGTIQPTSYTFTEAGFVTTPIDPNATVSFDMITGTASTVPIPTTQAVSIEGHVSNSWTPLSPLTENL